MRKLGRLAEAKECLDKAWNLTSLYVLYPDCYYIDSNGIYVDIFGKLQVGIPAIGFNWQLKYDEGKFDLIGLTELSFLHFKATGLEGERIEKAFVTVNSEESLRKRSSLSSSMSKNGLNEVEFALPMHFLTHFLAFSRPSHCCLGFRADE